MLKLNLLLLSFLLLFVGGCQKNDPDKTTSDSRIELNTTLNFTFGLDGTLQPAPTCEKPTTMDNVTFAFRKATNAEFSGQGECGVNVQSTRSGGYSLRQGTVFTIDLSKYSGIKTIDIRVLGCSKDEPNVFAYDLNNNLIESKRVIYPNPIIFNKGLENVKEIKIINTCEFVTNSLTIQRY